MRDRIILAGIVAFLAGAPPALAQGAPSGRTASSTAGRAGEREARDQAAPSINPTGRLETRVQSRVASRLRTRVDRYYNPNQTNAVSVFGIAESRARTTSTGVLNSASQPRSRTRRDTR